MTSPPWRTDVLQMVRFLVVVMIVGGLGPSHSIGLDRDGGYSLLVGVDLDGESDTGGQEMGREDQPTVLESTLSRIRSELEALSGWMHSAGKGRFYIKHVDILLQSPHDAHLVKTDGLAVTESYKKADIQISRKFDTIRVRNPNGCGMPGQSMQLPLERYEKRDAERGGKVLLSYFARYRWGVFEETWLGSDPQRYPKSYKDEQGNWRPTSCTNQTASTSLMSHAHGWMDGAQEFCDQGTHNRLAPTPHNILCGYRSVMGVIRETEDWRFVTEDSQGPRPTTFRLLRRSEKPYLYLLVDRQISAGSSQAVDRAREELVSLLRHLPPSTITQIGAFPSTQVHTPLSSEVDVVAPWTLSSKLEASFSSLLNSTGALRPSNWNFAAAMFKLAKSLQQLEHPEKVVVVILKAGPLARTTISRPHLFEPDIIASLRTAGVRLHALEIHAPGPGNGINLQNVVQNVGGSHLAIDPMSRSWDQEEKLKEFVKQIEAEFGEHETKDKDHLTGSRVAVYNGFLTNGPENANMFHPGENLHRLQLFLSSQVPLSSIRVNDVGLPMEQTDSEWNMDDDGLGPEHRYLHHSELAKLLNDMGAANQALNVTFECGKGDPLCEPYLVLLGEVGEGNGWEPSIQISTSSQDNFFDWSWIESAKPFHIYAELTTELPPGHSVQLTGVLCGMEEWEGSACQSFPMTDDGLGEPDILKGDGVHSLAILPVADGRYYVKVRCTVRTDQDNGAWVWPTKTRTFDYGSILTFWGTGRRSKPSIRKINDLSVTDTEREDEKRMALQLEWTAPVTYGADGKILNADAYDLRYASHYTDLIDNFDKCLKPRVEGAVLPKPDQPGTRQKVKVMGLKEMDDGSRNDVFFAIRSSSSGMQSEASNLVSSGLEPPPLRMAAQKMLPVMTVSVAEESTTEAQSPTTETMETGSPSAEPTTMITPDPTELSSSEAESSSWSTTQEASTTIEPSTLIPTTTELSSNRTQSPPNIPEEEQFFKRPIGYITAGVGGFLILVGLGGAVGYLYWKRKRLIDSGRLKLDSEQAYDSFS